MKIFCRTLVVSALALSISGIPLVAQNHHDDQSNRDHNRQHYVHHMEWRKGGHIGHQDWIRGEQVNFAAHHLRQPPRGYAWREVDGNYVLASLKTGLIESVVVASHAR